MRHFADLHWTLLILGVYLNDQYFIHFDGQTGRKIRCYDYIVDWFGYCSGSSGVVKSGSEVKAQKAQLGLHRPQIKYEANHPSDIRRFSIDPQITSLEELRSILVTAFDLKEEFSLSYKSDDDIGKEEFLILLSDWDLDAAFLRAHNSNSSPGSEPCINLRVEVSPKNALHNVEMQRNDTNPERTLGKSQKSPSSDTIINSDVKNMQTGLQGILINQMEKTLNLFSRALNLSEDPDAPTRPPLNQTEFHSFLGAVGHVVQGSKLREVVYQSGIDPSFRKVVWKHILNVYPDGMSGKERLDYMKKKSAEYYSLRDVWRDCLQKGQVSNTLGYVTNMVRKDVLRTDRHHKFYAGNDDNQNITCLFNILTTYALNHPTVSYCQGMSDIASPLLVVMNNEAHAYICLCALMSRLHPNFLLDGEAMTLKFAHLTESLQIYDPMFYAYLQSQQADDLLFCYRWLLLEMKREFAFEDALHMLEVLWSSLPPSPPPEELSLVDKEFCPESPEPGVDKPPISPLLKTPHENAYTKLCAIRRQSSLYSLTSNSKGKIIYKRMNQSLDENIGMGHSPKISKEFQSLDETLVNINEHPDRNFDLQNEMSSDSSNPDDLDSPVSGQGSAKFVGSSKYRKLKSGDLLRSFNNKYFSHLDLKDQNIAEAENENPTKKLIKDLSEFNNFTSKKSKTTAEHNGHDGKEQSVENKENIVRKIQTNPFLTDSPSPLEEQVTIDPNNPAVNNVDLLIPSTDAIALSNEINSLPNGLDLNENTKESTSKVNGILSNDNIPPAKKCDDVFIWENPLHSRCFETKNTIDSFQNIYNKSCDTFEKCENDNDSKDSNDVLVLENGVNEDEKSQEKQFIKNDDAKLKTLSSNALKTNSKFFSNMSQELENAKKNCEILLANKKCTNFQTIASTITNFQKRCDFQSPSSVNQNNHVINSCEEISESNPNKTVNVLLPPANLFGGGNPFLIFLCLTVLMQHRDVIMRNHMDYNELAMYFDKMVRKHNVHRVLNQARRMYSCYMKEHRVNINM